MTKQSDRPAKDAQQDRAARLKTALKANLARRKAQAKARETRDGDKDA
jgi:hypothetical protein